MSYEYDVFVSYPHEEIHKKWLYDIFLTRFTTVLRNELLREPLLYVDSRENATGMSWDLVVKNALARSRVLLPLWSIDYFLSENCRAESIVLFHREAQLGYRTLENNNVLVLPIGLFDGAGYPKFVKEMIHLECVDYNHIYQNYPQTEAHFKLIKLIDGFARDVKNSIGAAPNWDAEWLTPPWLDDPIKRWEKDGTLKIQEDSFELDSMLEDHDEDQDENG